MKKLIAIVLVILAAITLLSFVPLWSAKVKSGSTKVNTWDKIKINRGDLIID